jgi:hypothetical protein
MSSYHYRGKRYTKKPTASKAWDSVKKLANRVYEASLGSHPGGAEALVERMIREYPERPKQTAEPPVEAPGKADANKDRAA